VHVGSVRRHIRCFAEGEHQTLWYLHCSIAGEKGFDVVCVGHLCASDATLSDTSDANLEVFKPY